MRRTTQPTTLVDAYRDGRLTRRQFVEGALKLGVSATAAAGFLAACTKNKAAPPARLSGRVQILIGFDGGNTAPERQVQQTLAEAFIGAHPQVGIDFIRATSATAAASELSALVQRGSAPDIVLGIGLADVSRFADQHTWLDLHPLLRVDGVSTKAFVSEATSAAALSGYYGGTSIIPALPVGVHDQALAYNVELFSKAGLAAPPTSWSDSSWTYTGPFLAAAQALTVDQAGKNAGQTGFNSSKIARYGVARIAPETLFYGFGAHKYDSSKHQVTFDSSAAIEGAQFAGDLINRYHVQPTATQLATLAGAAGGADPALAAWRAGTLGMIAMSSAELATPYGSKVPFGWRAVPLPKGPSGHVGALAVSLATIVAASRQHQLAWEVLKFFAVDPAREGQLAYGGFGAIPPLGADVAAFTAGTKQAVGVDPAVWIAGLPSASAENDGWVPDFEGVQALFAASLASIVEGTSAATALGQLQPQAQAQINAWFKANKLPH